MNRPIKFRGIVAENVDDEFGDDLLFRKGQMIYGQVVFDGKTPYIVGPIVEVNDEYISLEYWCPVDRETLGEFTGFHDKNGVEVYAGDQLELLNCSPRFWTVEMDQGCWCGIWRSDGVIDARCPVAELVADGATVIGNIHENPENEQ